MATRHFLNIEYESDAGGEVALQMIEEMKKRPSVKVVGTMTWTNIIIETTRWKVTAPVWNVRSKPSMLDNVEFLGQLKQGEIVTQLEENEDWIRHNGAGDPKRVGWSGKRGLEKIV